MKRSVLNKAGLVLAVAGAAVVGGTTTALVQAAIPSSNDGQIHACYRNNAGLVDPKGALKVIDSDAGATCGAGETALNWGNGPEALLKDTNNQVLGKLVDLDGGSQAKVYNSTLNRLVPLEYQPASNHYRAGQLWSPIYQSNDCSGQTYTDVNPALAKTHLFSWTDTSNSSLLAYAIVQGNTTSSVETIQSQWTTSDNGQSYFCNPIPPYQETVYPFSLVNSPFASPVGAPLKF